MSSEAQCVELPPEAIHTELLWHVWDGCVNPAWAGRHTLGLRVLSRFDRTVPLVSAYAVYRDKGNDPDTPASAVFTPLFLVGHDHARAADLAPGKSLAFAVLPHHYPGLLSRVASLSPGSYWVSLLTGVEGADQEFVRVPGAAVAVFLETCHPPAGKM
ncbi:MAG TPA: hypothetical protein VKE74_18565 [Gemmataceae bacterium]|nr:hypothetical protein [Gemmataceae bacterium]